MPKLSPRRLPVLRGDTLFSDDFEADVVIQPCHDASGSTSVPNPPAGSLKHDHPLSGMILELRSELAAMQADKAPQKTLRAHRLLIALRKEFEKAESEEGEICKHELEAALSVLSLERPATIVSNSRTSLLDTPELLALEERAEQMLRGLRNVVPPVPGTSGWRYVHSKQTAPAPDVELWRWWHPVTGNVHVMLRWEAPGRLEQHVALNRDPDLAERHYKGLTENVMVQPGTRADALVNFFYTGLLSGRRYEVWVHRVFEDLLDVREANAAGASNVGMLMCEGMPSVEGYEDGFSGPWRDFEIGATPRGCIRDQNAPGSQFFEPLKGGRTKITLAKEIWLPAFVRWMVTDAVLIFLVRQIVARASAAWMKTLQDWNELGYPDRFDQQKAFYGPLCDRTSSLH